MTALAERTLLLVAGMHRSGTSALCAALKAAGATFGEGLLAPMQGVNDEGFWEDAELVDINERLFEMVGYHWYTLPADLAPVDWSASRFDALMEEACALLTRGFGQGRLQAVKDPRLCLTLPFWLAAARQVELASRVLCISRAPLEVAASLQKRDGFPLGYGLRLHLAYHRQLCLQAPDDSLWLTFDELLADPAAVVARVAGELPGVELESTTGEAVRTELRHQSTDAREGPLASAEAITSIDALAEAVETEYPLGAVPGALAAALVDRGQQLTELGEQHSTALATLEERDGDVAALAGQLQAAVATVEQRDGQIESLDQRLAAAGGELEQAMATVQERDGQIEEIDQRLHETGRQHGEALEHIGALDARWEAFQAQLQRVFELPVAGRLFEKMWHRESR